MAVSMFESGPCLLDSPETMFRALRELVADDASRWRGTVAVWHLEPAGTSWRMEINDDKGNQAVAVVGQSLLLTYGRLLVLNADEL